MDSRVTAKVVRRLNAADGYLGLGMPERALQELSHVEDAGPFEASRQFLLGQTYKAQQRFREAIKPLYRAAELLPMEHSQFAWRSLSECFRESGRTELADVAEMTANAVASMRKARELNEPEFHVAVPTKISIILKQR